METRKLKVIIAKSGGNASENSKVYKLSIPNKWAVDMELELDNRTVEVTYDSNKKEITVKKVDTD